MCVCKFLRACFYVFVAFFFQSVQLSGITARKIDFVG